MCANVFHVTYINFDNSHMFTNYKKNEFFLLLAVTNFAGQNKTIYQKQKYIAKQYTHARKAKQYDNNNIPMLESFKYRMWKKLEK
jgi:hypothetical protein